MPPGYFVITNPAFFDDNPIVFYAGSRALTPGILSG
jgi:hypothetical protein